MVLPFLLAISLYALLLPFCRLFSFTDINVRVLTDIFTFFFSLQLSFKLFRRRCRCFDQFSKMFDIKIGQLVGGTFYAMLFSPSWHEYPCKITRKEKYRAGPCKHLSRFAYFSPVMRVILKFLP